MVTTIAIHDDLYCINWEGDSPNRDILQSNPFASAIQICGIYWANADITRSSSLWQQTVAFSFIAGKYSPLECG